MAKVYSLQEVSKHNTKEDLWFIISGNVYDATSFAHEHPGGEEIMIDQGGKDTTEDFEEVEHSSAALEVLSTLKIGTLKRQAGDVGAKFSSKGVSSSYATANDTSSSSTSKYVVMALCGAFSVGLWLYSSAA